MLPSGVAAAGLLGFTTQTSSRREVSTDASSLPRKLVGDDTVVRTRRPPAWATLSSVDAALLEVLRRAGRDSELGPEETIRRTLQLLDEGKRLRRLIAIAESEPPRVRALLGALGEELGCSARALAKLRGLLNPLSKFDFGIYAHLSTAAVWQAKRGVP